MQEASISLQRTSTVVSVAAPLAACESSMHRNRLSPRRSSVGVVNNPSRPSSPSCQRSVLRAMQASRDLRAMPDVEGELEVQRDAETLFWALSGRIAGDRSRETRGGASRHARRQHRLAPRAHNSVAAVGWPFTNRALVALNEAAGQTHAAIGFRRSSRTPPGRWRQR